MSFITLDHFNLMCWEALELPHLPKCAPSTAIRNAYGLAILSVISKISRAVSPAAFDGQIHFKGIKVINYDGPRNGPLEPIPPEYFWRPRQIEDSNEILAVVWDDDTTAYSDAYNGGEANPKWINVVVDKREAETFVKSLTPLVRALAGKSDPLDTFPIGLRYTLSAAVTHLAFGATREASELEESKLTVADGMLTCYSRLKQRRVLEY